MPLRHRRLPDPQSLNLRRHPEARTVPRRSSPAGRPALQRREQRVQLGLRHSAGALEELAGCAGNRRSCAITSGLSLLASTMMSIASCAVVLVVEPLDALVVHGEEAPQQVRVLRRPVRVHHRAGERQFLRVVDGQAEIAEARRLGVEVERRQQDRGVDRAGLQRLEARRGRAREHHVELARLHAVRRQHALEIHLGDVLRAADRDDLALEVLRTS